MWLNFISNCIKEGPITYHNIIPNLFCDNHSSLNQKSVSDEEGRARSAVTRAIRVVQHAHF